MPANTSIAPLYAAQSRGGRRLSCSRIVRLCAAVLMTCPFPWSGAAAADGELVVVREGTAVTQVIDSFRRQGVPFAYSTELISADMLVRESTSGVDPVTIVNDILRPYQLQVHAIEGLLVVGRLAAPLPVQPADKAEISTPGKTPVAEVTVSASRYEILRELTDAPSLVSQQTMQQLPLLGDDPLRAVQRLPGNASNGASAKSHLRGAEQQDTGLILNGLRLLDPFHVRDYQNLFSAIDSRATNGIEVYTGGFPVKYGNGIGGLVLIDTMSPETDRHTELGLSVYNTSFLSAGRAAGGDIEWLFSARRGNLDLVLNQELGEPSYNDVFAEIGINLSSATHVSINGLVATDNVLAVTEADPSEREASTNDTRNAQFWINWTQDWSESLSSSSTLSTAALNSSRLGSVNDPEEIIATLDDQRDINVWGARQDWTLDIGDAHRLLAGASYQRIDGQFNYRGDVDYFGVFTRISGVPDSIRRLSDTTVDGETFSVYVADRWQLSQSTTIELGLRWDKQTYTDAPNNEQLSPRISLLHALSPRTDLRISAGRYFQAQAVNDLQVEDGITTFAEAQRADQFIVGLQHRFGNGYSIRAEIYLKNMTRLRTRFENLLDPLAVMPELKPDRVAISPDSARAAGLELSVARENDNGLDWWASYTLSRVRDRVGGQSVARSWDQRHAGQLGVLWQRNRWDLSAVLRVHSGWPKTGLLVDPASDPDDPTLIFAPRNSSNFAPFATLDLRVGYRAPVRVGEMSLFFELSNASNRRNPCCIDFELEEEGAANPELLQNDEYWFPLLPAIGILWEF